MPLVAADAVLLVVGPDTEHVDHVDARMPALRETARWGRLSVVLSGTGQYARAEIADRLGIPVVGEMPRDRWGAGALTGRMAGWIWTRTRLARAAAELATRLSTEFQPDTSEVPR